ncbi:hypothetical protein [Bradyrhizobium erythrophlei]|nr:hypothetical protein [Bradyrhizobium erythrophlei]
MRFIALLIGVLLLSSNACAQEKCFDGPTRKQENNSWQTWNAVNNCGTSVTVYYTVQSGSTKTSSNSVVPACESAQVVQTFKSDTVEFGNIIVHPGPGKKCRPDEKASDQVPQKSQPQKQHATPSKTSAPALRPPSTPSAPDAGSPGPSTSRANDASAMKQCSSQCVPVLASANDLCRTTVVADWWKAKDKYGDNSPQALAAQQLIGPCGARSMALGNQCLQSCLAR